MARDDFMQKTWIPEGTREYRAFKQVTCENRYLASFLDRSFSLRQNELVLDVGGRDGDIAFAIQTPRAVHIVDPDPTLEPSPALGRFWHCRVQEADIPFDTYRLIICSHVLGYLARKNEQKTVIEKLLPSLSVDGTLILFYNRNTGYIGELLNYSKHQLNEGHYDFFDESIIDTLPVDQFSVTRKDIWFKAAYPNFDQLSRACWFLFGGTDQDIDAVSAKFLSKLIADNHFPELDIEQRIVSITKIR